MWLFLSIALADEPDLVRVPLGKSTVITFQTAPLAVAVTDPAVATVHTLGVPEVLQVQGVALGKTDLVISWANRKDPEILDIEVARDVTQLERVIERIAGPDGPRVVK